MINAIGNTPTVRLKRVERLLGEVELYAKCEYMNPGGSIKDRAAAAILGKAKKDGLIKHRGRVATATSGNFGISLSMLCAHLGYKATVVMPTSASKERVCLVRAYGGEVKLVDGGMAEAIKVAHKVTAATGALYLDQFTSPESVKCHYTGTGREIWQNMQSKIDIFVAGVGTGGTLVGAGSFLKKCNSKLKIYAVEPSESPVLSGGKAQKHGIEGIGADLIPPLFNREIVDGIVGVSLDESIEALRLLAKEEGIFAGVSTGASLAAIIRLSKTGKLKNKRVVFIIADGGERYFSRGVID